VTLWRGTTAVSTPDRVMPLAIVQLLRPRQWTKNVLVVAAPAAAGMLTRGSDLAAVAIAFVAFCLAASGTYCLNDAADAERDRCHPVKRYRPVACGDIDVTTARLVGAALLASSIGVALLVGRWQLPAAVVGYVALTTSYTLWLKHMAVIDVAAVAGGFVIRALAGSAATGARVSDWFLVTATFGALVMVSGKRSTELAEANGAARHRSVLAEYPPMFLSHLRAVSIGMTLLSYTLFAFDPATSPALMPLFKLSIIPFGLAVFRYALRVEQGAGGAPEELVLGDRPLQVLAVVWAALFLAAVYIT